MDKITVQLVFERSTKNTHKYQAVAEGAAIDSVYINKSALPTAEAAILITVEKISGQDAERESGRDAPKGSAGRKGAK